MIKQVTTLFAKVTFQPLYDHNLICSQFDFAATFIGIFIVFLSFTLRMYSLLVNFSK